VTISGPTARTSCGKGAQADFFPKNYRLNGCAIQKKRLPLHRKTNGGYSSVG
jgi:hypothetical protein